MRYAGLVGEFKWWGFAISLTICIAFALLIFTRFDYVKDMGVDPGKVAAQQAQQTASDMKQMQENILKLEQRISQVECGTSVERVGMNSGKKQGSVEHKGTNH